MKELIAKWIMWLGVAISEVMAFLNSNASGLGVLVAFLGLLMTIYYKHKADKRAARAEAAGRLVELVDRLD